MTPGLPLTLSNDLGGFPRSLLHLAGGLGGLTILRLLRSIRWATRLLENPVLAVRKGVKVVLPAAPERMDTVVKRGRRGVFCPPF